MKLIGLILLLFGTSAFAAGNTYDLNMQLSLNGKQVSSPKVTIVEGETGYITQNDGDQKTFIEVIAKEGEMHGKKGILLNMKVGSIDKSGKRTIRATPTVLVKNKESAQVTIGHRTENGTDDVLNLDITVTRKTL